MSFRKILLVKLRSLGDTVLMTAPLAEVRKAYPRAEIHVVCRTPWGELLQADPAIQKLWHYTYHKDRAARAKAVARLALQLRKEKFDAVINFHASPSSAMLSFATGAKVRSVHFHGHKDKNRHSTVVVPGKGILKPVIERDMDAVRALGVSIPEGQLPKLHLTSEELFHAADEIRGRGLGSPLLGLGLGASRATKQWPMNRFVQVVRGWIEQKHGSVLLLAGPEEEKLAQEFLDATSRENWKNKIYPVVNQPLRKMTALLGQCQVFLGNDSGPKHLAVAMGVPTVTLFGPEHPFEWHPYSQENHPYFFIEKLACRKDASPGMPAWCGLHVCDREGHRCMKEIEVEPVLAKVLSLVQS